MPRELLGGDFNARTNIAIDYIFEHSYGSDGLLPKLLDDNCYEKTSPYTYLKRNCVLPQGYTIGNRNLEADIFDTEADILDTSSRP